MNRKSLAVICGVGLMAVGIGGCGSSGGSSSGGEGTEADKVELVDVATSTGDASSTATNSGIPDISAPTEKTTDTTTQDYSCPGGGSLTLTIGTALGSVTATSLVTDVTINGTGTDCGASKFNGTLELTGPITINLQTGTSSSTFTETATGHTTACTALSADLTIGVSITDSTTGAGSVTLNGTLAGTCSATASCTLSHVTYALPATASTLRSALCTACGISSTACGL